MQKRIALSESIGTLEDIFGYHELYRAGKQCCKGVRWKNSTQRFEAHLFSKTAVMRRKVLDGTYKQRKLHHFVISERGKTRPIDSPNIQDRQVQKLFTQKALLPHYLPSMIYNNGASLPGKGFEFSMEMLKEDLRRHFRHYGRDGSLILIDFTQFFPSVSKEQIKMRHQRIILVPVVRIFADGIVDETGLEVGMPLGVEPSQAEMIAFPSALDNFIKCQLGIKGAGHYMDDYYIIVPPDMDAKEIMKAIIEKAESLELTVSRSKSRIVPLTKPFRYCKAKYTLTETGKVLVFGNRDSVKRGRRKIKAFYEKVESGEMSYTDLWSSVNGVFGYFDNYNDHNKVLKLRRLFYAIYGFSPEKYENFKMRGIQYELYYAQTV